MENTDRPGTDPSSPEDDRKHMIIRAAHWAGYTGREPAAQLDAVERLIAADIAKADAHMAGR